MPTAKDSFRIKFIKADLIKAKKKQLNDWEKEFIKSIETIDPKNLTTAQFNRLQEIAEKR